MLTRYQKSRLKMVTRWHRILGDKLSDREEKLENTIHELRANVELVRAEYEANAAEKHDLETKRDEN